MEIKHEKVKKLLESRGWSQVIFAQRLDMDYSYIYRVMNKQRGIGKKFITNFMILCEEEGLNFKDYVNLN